MSIMVEAVKEHLKSTEYDNSCLGLELSLQLEHINGIGQLLESVGSIDGQLEELPAHTLEQIGFLIRSLTEISKSLAYSIDSKPKAVKS